MRKAVFFISVLFIVVGAWLLLYGLRDHPETTPQQSLPTRSEQSTLGPVVEGLNGVEARVVKVVDGDTVEVQVDEGVAKLRYIGIDTPETVDPRRPVGCFGKEASLENRRLVEGKGVILQRDISETDKFGRLLRYVYVRSTEGGLIFVNDYLVRQGFAKSATYPPDVKYSEQFRQAEREAREGGRGLWGKCVT